MSENSKPVAAEQKDIAPLSHVRILWTMGIAALIASILCAVFISVRFGAGLAIGGILSFVNYYWIKISLKRIFDKAIAGESPRFLGANYFLRYVAFAAGLAIIYVSGAVPIVAVLLGLCIFALAIVIEGILRIFSSISKREEF